MEMEVYNIQPFGIDCCSLDVSLRRFTQLAGLLLLTAVEAPCWAYNMLSIHQSSVKGHLD